MYINIDTSSMMLEVSIHMSFSILTFPASIIMLETLTLKMLETSTVDVNPPAFLEDSTRPILKCFTRQFES
jgi:hypothetical protein